MADFFRRALANLLNEQAVKTLAQNKTFQNFALKTHLHVEKTKKALQNVDLRKPTEALPNVPSLKKVSDFAEALKQELTKDMKKYK
jgi:hypothetical protein